MYAIEIDTDKLLEDRRTGRAMTFTFAIDAQLEINSARQRGYDLAEGAKVVRYDASKEVGK